MYITQLRCLAILMLLPLFSLTFAEECSPCPFQECTKVWAKGFRQSQCVDHPPAFEKIYVSRQQIVWTPLGPSYFNCYGQRECVRSVSEDENGLYVIKIQTQCPLCGCAYCGKEPPEGKSCPIFEKERLPNLWTPY